MINRIRLPLITNKAQFPTERNVFRRADGSTQVLSAVVRNTYQLTTDYLPEKWHKRLVIALSHDDVRIENEAYLGGIVMDGEYSIDWLEFRDYPVAQGSTTIQVTPFDAMNSNCQTCEQATQLNLTDDTFPDPLEEGQSAVFENVLENDNICCYPSVVSLSSYNTEFLDGASITQSGQLTVNVKDSTGNGSGVKVATYRVTCPDGSYDEADVFADIEGTAVACNPPGQPVLNSVNTSGVNISWPHASPVPPSYDWRIVLASNPSVIIGSGNTNGTTAVSVGLEPDTDYIFVVNSNCGNGQSSSSATLNFSTPAGEPVGNCGRYQFYRPGSFGSGNITYKDCLGNLQTQTVTSFSMFETCMLESSPGIPDDSFSTTGGISYEYLGPC